MSIVTASTIFLGLCGVYCVGVGIYVHEEGIRQEQQEIMNKIMESSKKIDKIKFISSIVAYAISFFRSVIVHIFTAASNKPKKLNVATNKTVHFEVNIELN